MEAHWDGSIRYSENGTAMLAPYAMPRSINEYGEDESQGRYAVAYSRDGWFVIDAQEMIVLRWCASEDDAREAQRVAAMQEP